MAACLVMAGLLAGPAVLDAAVTRYFEAPCRDENQDGIDDFFEGPLDEAPWVDIMVIFDGASYNRALAEAQVQQVINDHQPSAEIPYASAYSPYIFVDNVTLFDPPAATPLLQGLLAINNVEGIRSYERFTLSTGREVFAGRDRHLIHSPEEGTGGQVPGSRTAPSGTGEPDPNPAILPLEAPPDVLIYFVDSGIDEDGYWGIDVTTDEPLAPAAATDPLDISEIKHGSFMRSLSKYTVESAQLLDGGRVVGFADVKVALARGGETTTLELTRAFDAIKAHLIHEQDQGNTFDIVVNCSYDTDGGIANHDVIYETGRRLDVRDSGAVGPGPAILPGTAGNPCAVTLFDGVYRNLTTNHGAVICVGAGNDGLIAAFAINEVGQSPNATIVVTALDDEGFGPAPYSNYGQAPDGLNGHPDIMAPGTSPAPGFNYLLEGTSVATALTSAMAAFTLSVNSSLSPQGVLNSLISSGQPLQPIGNKYYGDAILKLPGAPVHIILIDPEPTPPSMSAEPNPARPFTRLKFETAAAGDVQVRIFDVAGRLVRSLFQGDMDAGRHEIPFDGLTDGGAAAPAGIYLARVVRPGGVETVRVLVQR